MNKITTWLFPPSLIMLVGTLSLCFILGVLAVYGTSRMDETGLSGRIGAIGEEITTEGLDKSVPSLGKMFGPSINVVATKISGSLAQVPQVSINGTPVVGLKGPGEQGGITTGGGSNLPTLAPQGCQQTNSPLSIQALSLWRDGKVLEAVAILTRPGAPTDCLAVGLWRDYVKPLMVVWNQIEPNAGADSSTQLALGKECLKMNPKFAPCYEVVAWANYRIWSNKPEQSTAAQVLRGFKIGIGPLQSTGWWDQMDDDDDTRTITVAAGTNYGGTTIEKVVYIKKFLNWVGIKWEYGDKEKTFIVAGDPIVPIALPSVSAPTPDAYQPQTSASFTAIPNIAPVVTSTQHVPNGSGGGGEPFVTCTYPGSRSGQYLAGWAGAPPRSTNLETVKRLNPGLWDAYSRDTTKSQQVKFPLGTRCQ